MIWLVKIRAWFQQLRIHFLPTKERATSNNLKHKSWTPVEWTDENIFNIISFKYVEVQRSNYEEYEGIDLVRAKLGGKTYPVRSSKLRWVTFSWSFMIISVGVIWIFYWFLYVIILVLTKLIYLIFVRPNLNLLFEFLKIAKHYHTLPLFLSLYQTRYCVCDRNLDVQYRFFVSWHH